MSNTKDFRTRDEIVVNVGKSQAAADAEAKRRQGTPDTAKPDDGILKRRTGGAMTFYDLGQITDGAGGWLDIDFESVLVPDIGFLDWNAISPADQLALNSVWLDVAAADLETTFRPLEYETAERYGLDVYVPPTTTFYPVARNASRYVSTTGALVSGTKWTVKGLGLPAALSNASFLSYGAFNPWGVGSWGSVFKWTTGPTYASPSVGERAIARSAKIFLTPMIVNAGFEASNMSATDIMGANYRTYQRSFWLDRDYQSTTIGLLTNPFNGSGYLDLTAADKMALVEHVRPHALEVETFAGHLPDATLWPQYTDSIFNHWGDPGSTPFPGYTAGQLIAIVKQAGQVFYVWANAAVGPTSRHVIDLTGLY